LRLAASQDASNDPSLSLPGLHVLVANITECGPQFYLFAATTLYHVMLITETHFGEQRMGELRSELAKRGWNTVMSPALPTGRSETGTSGGTLICVRNHIATEDIDLTKDRGDDWCRLTLNLKGFDLDLYSFYADHTIGFAGRNASKFAEVAAQILSRGNEFGIFGDFNMPPEELVAAGYHELIGATCTTPLGAQWTCRNGLRILDYGFSSRGITAITARHLIDDEVPWGPHLAARIVLDSNPRTVLIRTAIGGPKIDPSVIKSKRKSNEALPEWNKSQPASVSAFPAGESLVAPSLRPHRPWQPPWAHPL